MIRVASMVRVLSYRTPRLPIIRFEVALEGMDVPIATFSDPDGTSFSLEPAR